MNETGTRLIALIAVALLVTAGCGPQITEDKRQATATPVVAAPTGRCGDGVCDAAEQANPSLCPQDCESSEMAPAAAPETPGATPEDATATPKPQAEGVGDKCGDGICDAAERADPALCPADCAAAAESADDSEDDPGGGEEPQCEVEEWTMTIEGCSTWKDMQVSAELCTAFVGGFTVQESCRIIGTGSGRYKNCEYVNPTGLCTFEIECPEFQMPISGEAVWTDGITETLRIQVDSSSVFESGTMTCYGQTKPIDFVPVLQTGFASATRNGDGHFCEIEVVEDIDSFGVHVKGQDAVAPENASYDFIAEVYPGIVEFSWEDFDIDTD
jgi:hypothetical protein